MYSFETYILKTLVKKIPIIPSICQVFSSAQYNPQWMSAKVSLEAWRLNHGQTRLNEAV